MAHGHIGVPPLFPGTTREGRDPLDRYYTPPRLAREAVSRLPIKEGDTALEPSAGAGAFWEALTEAGAIAHAIDIDPNAPVWLKSVEHEGATSFPIKCVGDFLTFEMDTPFTWIVGNPPFREAEAHARRALSLTKRHVVLLLLLDFLTSAERVPFWTEYPARKVWPLSQRPRQWKASYNYAIYWWDKEWIESRGDKCGEYEVLSWR